MGDNTDTTCENKLPDCEFKQTSANCQHCIIDDKFYKVSIANSDPLDHEASIAQILDKYQQQITKERNRPYRFTPSFIKYCKVLDREVLVLQSVEIKTFDVLLRKVAPSILLQTYYKIFTRYFTYVSKLGLSHSDLHWGNYGEIKFKNVSFTGLGIIDWGRANINWETSKAILKQTIKTTNTKHQPSIFSINDTVNGWLCDLATIAYQFNRIIYAYDLKDLQQKSNVNQTAFVSAYNDCELSYNIGSLNELQAIFKKHVDKIINYKDQDITGAFVPPILFFEFIELGLAWLGLYIKHCHMMFTISAHEGNEAKLKETVRHIYNDPLTFNDSTLHLFILFANGVINGQMYNSVYPNMLTEHSIENIIEIYRQPKNDNQIESNTSLQYPNTRLSTPSSRSHSITDFLVTSQTNSHATGKHCNRTSYCESQSTDVLCQYYLKLMNPKSKTIINGGALFAKDERYIILQSKKVFLKDIKGKYKYTNDHKTHIHFRTPSNNKHITRKILKQRMSKQITQDQYRKHTIDNFCKPTKQCIAEYQDRINAFQKTYKEKVTHK